MWATCNFFFLVALSLESWNGPQHHASQKAHAQQSSRHGMLAGARSSFSPWEWSQIFLLQVLARTTGQFLGWAGSILGFSFSRCHQQVHWYPDSSGAMGQPHAPAFGKCRWLPVWSHHTWGAWPPTRGSEQGRCSSAAAHGSPRQRRAPTARKNSSPHSG